METGREFILRIHPSSQERYLKALESYTTEELMWIIAYRMRELEDKVDAYYDACNLDKKKEASKEA